MGTNPKDPRSAFLNQLILEKSRVSGFKGFIFLCGGPVDNWETHTNSARAVLRQAIRNSSDKDLENRLRLAEDLRDWFSDSDSFKDLVTFEEHLAALSSVVILIVEAPGAIAELGSFAATKELRERLLIVIGEHHYNQKSFIKLGPISFLEKNFNIISHKYDWHTKNADNKIEPVLEEFHQYTDAVLNAVRERLDKPAQEEVFQTEYRKHKLLLISSLCAIFGALTATEIKKYLKWLEIYLRPDPLQQYLFVLEKAGLIRRKEFGAETYYVGASEPNIKFRFKSTKLDILRLQFDVVEYYAQYEKHKYQALRQALGSAAP